MRIGISCYPTWGGSGVVATELAMALASGGDEVHVISYALPSRLQLADPRLFFHEVVVPHYPLFEYPPYSLALASKMAEIARHQRLDVLHVHYAVPNAVSAILAREIVAPLRLPVVTTLHGTDITIVGQDHSFHAITKFSIEKSDRITAVSSFLREETIFTFGCTGCDVVVIHNFIDPEQYTRSGHEPLLRKQYDGRKILIHISNFRAVKRVRDVVRIFAKVREVIPSVLVMVGDGPDRVHPSDDLADRRAQRHRARAHEAVRGLDVEDPLERHRQRLRRVLALPGLGPCRAELARRLARHGARAHRVARPGLE